MKIELGVKSDPIEYRYSFEWLFDLMRRAEVYNLQLGSFTELYFLPDEYFLELRELATAYGIRIKSVFTAHRELGGAFSGNSHLERVFRRNHERLIEVAALLGADYCGSNPGAIPRDLLHTKDEGVRRWLGHAKDLSERARSLGLKALCLEPMSCAAEPPTTPEEIEHMMTELANDHSTRPDDTVPVYLCTDISHGYADRDGRVVHSNLELFEFAVPWTAEFHIKNTDERFDSTFGFTGKEMEDGIIDLTTIRDLIAGNASRWPVADLVGYLEIGGPKLGRDYSDHHLERQLLDSLNRIRRDFGALVAAPTAV